MTNPAEETVDYSWDQATADAKSEHSEEPEEGSQEEASVSGEAVQAEGDDTESAETEETEDEEAASPDSDSEAAETDSLPTDDEMARIRELDPALADKVSNVLQFRAEATRKTQEAAEAMRTVAEVNGWLAGARTDPAGALRQLAEQMGVNVAELAVEPLSKPKPISESLGESLHTRLADLGLEDLADPLAGAFSEVLESELDRRVASRLQPFERQQERAEQEKSEREVNQANTQMDEKYKGWRRYEPQMASLAHKLMPLNPDGKTRARPDMNAFEFLEHLYKTVSGDKLAVSQTRKLIEKQTRAAANAGEPRGGVGDQNVDDEPPEGAPMSEYWAWAKRHKGDK